MWYINKNVQWTSFVYNDMKNVKYYNAEKNINFINI
jgi:hypothetical protein